MAMAMLDKMPFLRRMLEKGYTISLAILISGIVGLVLAFPVMLLWNFVFGSVLKINMLQAWALNVLMGILFGSRVSNGRK